ncbi:unnamed protein product, partial [Closterium sp. NIES-53]
MEVAQTSPALRWTLKVGDASVFRVWGALSLVQDAKASKLSPRTLCCVFLGFPTDAPLWQFYHPRSRRVFSSQEVTFDESGPHSSGVSQVDPPPLVEPLEISSESSGPSEGGDPAADDTTATRRSPRLETPPGFPPWPSSPPPQPGAMDFGAETVGAEPGGAETEGEGSGGAATGGAAIGGAATGGASIGGDPAGGPGAGQPPQPDLLQTLSPQAIRAWIVRRGSPSGGGYGPAGAGAASLGGTAGAGGTGGSPGGAGGAAGAGGTRGVASAGGAGDTSPRGATSAGGTGPTSPGGTAGAGGAGGAVGAGGAGAGGTGGAGAAGLGGARTGGAGAAGAGGAVLARGATGAAGSGGTGGTARAGGAGAGGTAGAGGATGAAGTGGTAGAGGARSGGTGGTGGAGAAGPGGARTRGGGAARAGGAAGAEGAGGATRATGTGGAGGTTSDRGPGAAGARGATGVGGARGATGAAGAGGAGAAGDGGARAAGTAPRRLFFYPQLQSSLLPRDSRHEPETRASTLLRARRIPRPRPPTVPGTHGMALRPSSIPQRVVLPEPPASSLPHVPDPESDLARAASPSVTCLLASVVTDPDLESTAAFALVTELVDFAARSRLDYVATLVTQSDFVCLPFVGGEPALSSDVLEDSHFELECLAAALPNFASLLLCPEGDPDALDIPTPRSYAEAIAGEYSSQWQTAMVAKMASWKSTDTYGVDFFQNLSPTPKMTTLQVLLHVAAQRDYKLHSLNISTAFLQGSLHEEIWLRCPPGFTGSFPAGTLWSLQRPVYGLRQAPCEWHNTLRTTLVALGLAPSSADPSL